MTKLVEIIKKWIAAFVSLFQTKNTDALESLLKERIADHSETIANLAKREDVQRYILKLYNDLRKEGKSVTLDDVEKVVVDYWKEYEKN